MVDIIKLYKKIDTFLGSTLLELDEVLNQDEKDFIEIVISNPMEFFEPTENILWNSEILEVSLGSEKDTVHIYI